MVHVVSGKCNFRLFIVAYSQKLMGGREMFRAEDQIKTVFSSVKMNPNFKIQCLVGGASYKRLGKTKRKVGERKKGGRQKKGR